MARRRSTGAPPMAEEVRATVARKYRRVGARYVGLGATGPGGGTVPPDWSPFDRLADDLAAGDPVELYAWQLPRWLPGRPRRGRVVIDGDGTVSPL